MSFICNFLFLQTNKKKKSSKCFFQGLHRSKPVYQSWNPGSLAIMILWNVYRNWRLNSQTLVCRNNDLENRWRRNNLVIHRLLEPHDEKPEQLPSSVGNPISTKLDIQCYDIKRCHRLRTPRSETPRPLIIKLLDFRTKADILTKASKLKGADVYIYEDLSARVRQIRRNYGNILLT